MNRTKAIPVTLLAAALTFGASACSDDGPNASSGSGTTQAPGTTEATATSEPAGTTESPGTTAGTDATAPGQEPTVDSATDVVVGLTEDAATTAAEANGWTLRVIRRDGDDLPITMEYRTNRVNVDVTDGEVTAVLNIG